VDQLKTLFSDPFSLLMLAALGVLIIFMIRSNRKRQAAARDLQSNMQPGVEVMLQSGIFGTIISIDDEANRVTVQSGPGTQLIVHRNAVASVIPAATPEETLVADDDPKFGKRSSEGESPEASEK
jgi:preprotein translocase subunit YajC